MWTMNMVIFLNFWLMMIWWKYANLEYAEHVESCHFHQHSSHGRNDNCSLCSRHQQLLSSHLSNLNHKSTVTLVLALLRKTLKCIQVMFLVLLILLAGDVETNPGPGKTLNHYYPPCTVSKIRMATPYTTRIFSLIHIIIPATQNQL